MRIRTLWRVPVFCLLASALSYWLTIFPGYLFYVNRAANADGSIAVSVDPLRSTLLQIALFLLVLLAGGLWAFRSMTRREIAFFCVIADFADACSRSGTALASLFSCECQLVSVTVL